MSEGTCVKICVRNLESWAGVVVIEIGGKYSHFGSTLKA